MTEVFVRHLTALKRLVDAAHRADVVHDAADADRDAARGDAAPRHVVDHRMFVARGVEGGHLHDLNVRAAFFDRRREGRRLRLVFFLKGDDGAFRAEMGGYRGRTRDDLFGEGAHEVFIRLDERFTFRPVHYKAFGPGIEFRVGREARAALANHAGPFYRL